MIKILMLYKDWLLQTRGEIRPEIGDKIKIGACYYIVEEIKEYGYIHVKLDSSILQFSKEETKVIHIGMSEDCYVEIEHNPNQLKEFKESTNKHFEELYHKLAIEFADWIAQYQYEKDQDTGLWQYWDNGIGKYTTKELFELFKTERYEKA